VPKAIWRRPGRPKLPVRPRTALSQLFGLGTSRRTYGRLVTIVGPVKVYTFHMVLSHSRGLFCRYTTSMDLATFWDCHVGAFDHFGGVPGTILYDRTKTVIRRHVGRGEEVPLHPEAAGVRRPLRVRPSALLAVETHRRLEVGRSMASGSTSLRQPAPAKDQTP
jgi:hypothetical protein